MAFDATFWVAVSFLIFFGVLIYFKIPQKVNQLLSDMILGIQKEIEESEKLRIESKELLENAQKKLDSATDEAKKILDTAEKDAENLIIQMNDKFHKSSEIKKNLAKTKIIQMKENAIKEVKNTSIRIAIDSVKKAISTSVDKSKLDILFEKNLKDTKSEFKKINS
tara:strand:+ start:158 stop:655 length:498 start_codon:yes stop_codon:yes gene_type:complete